MNRYTYVGQIGFRLFSKGNDPFNMNCLPGINNLGGLGDLDNMFQADADTNHSKQNDMFSNLFAGQNLDHFIQNTVENAIGNILGDNENTHHHNHFSNKKNNGPLKYELIDVSDDFYIKASIPNTWQVNTIKVTITCSKVTISNGIQEQTQHIYLPGGLHEKAAKAKIYDNTLEIRIPKLPDYDSKELHLYG